MLLIKSLLNRYSWTFPTRRDALVVGEYYTGSGKYWQGKFFSKLALVHIAAATHNGNEADDEIGSSDLESLADGQEKAQKGRTR